MKYGYVRVSTEEQNSDLQTQALKRAGVKKIFTDHGKGGSTLNRPALSRCLSTLQSGDTLIVWKLDRLGRSARDLINTLHDLTERGIHFKSLTEAIDTTTPIGRAMLHMAALLAELERGIITERTRAGVKAAKKRGVKFGRKPQMSPQQIAHAQELRDAGRGESEIMALLRVSRSTLWRNRK